jgi:hypothetical protein
MFDFKWNHYHVNNFFMEIVHQFKFFGVSFKVFFLFDRNELPNNLSYTFYEAIVKIWLL